MGVAVSGTRFTVAMSSSYHQNANNEELDPERIAELDSRCMVGGLYLAHVKLSR